MLVAMVILVLAHKCQKTAKGLRSKSRNPFRGRNHTSVTAEVRVDNFFTWV